MARQTRLTRQQQRIVRELVKKHDPLIREAFEAAIRNARGALDFAALVRAVEIGDLNRAAELLRLNQAVLFPLEEAIRAATIAGGMSVTLPKGVAGAFSFNGRHPRAEQIIADTGARLVTEIGSPGVEPIRSLILQAQREGVGTQITARRLAGTVNRKTGIREGGIMGLDGPRAQRSTKVREILGDPDQIASYFKGDKPRFTSTDRRFDAMVRKAIAEGRALPKADIERIAKLHDARLLKARGKAISEHEAFTAQALGRDEAYEQMFESGVLEGMEIEWNHNTLKNPRDEHQALDGKRIKRGETFEMADGTRMKHPHDPAGGIKHSAGCRCSAIYRPQFRRPS